jgi:para-aminobenzoate synthetase
MLLCSCDDAAFFFADRLVVLDHKDGVIYAVSVHDGGTSISAAHEWLDSTELLLRRMSDEAIDGNDGNDAYPLRSDAIGDVCKAPPKATIDTGVRNFVLSRSKEQYLRDVGACMDALYCGDSYEICLTTSMQMAECPSAWEFYRVLRAVNPAPYAAWLHFGQV